MSYTGNASIDFQVKSQLAKLLATENITVMHNPSVKTAYFDVKNRNLILPVWQNISLDLYEMLVVHETGHALDTPADDWVNAIKDIEKRVYGEEKRGAQAAIKDFLNVLEDARIDKRQKRRYPGSKRNYINGVKELLERNFFGIRNRDVNTLPFIDRVNLYFKCGTLLNISFTAEEKAMLNRIGQTETFDEVVALTEEVYGWAKSNKDEGSELPINEDFDFDDEGEGEGDGFSDSDFDETSDDEDEEGDTRGRASDEETDEDADESNETSDEAEDEGDDAGEEQSEGSNDEGSGEHGQHQDEDFVPQSVTEQASRDNLDQIVQNDDCNYIYANLPKYDLSKIVDDYPVVLKDFEKEIAYKKVNGYLDIYNASVTTLNEFLAKEKDSISFMVKEFEMRKAADAYARTSISKTGVIDTNKLHSYRYNEDIFRKVSVVPNGKNHGFVMFLDWSGSMATDLKSTLSQLFSLVMFCKRVQIPFDVYIFRCNELGNYPFQTVENSLMFNIFKLRNVLSSRMNQAQLRTMMTGLWMIAHRVSFYCDMMGRTPLNEALYVAADIVNAFKAKYKCQIVSTIVLTDGCSDPTRGVHMTNVPPAKKNGNKFFLRDEVTKKNYVIKGYGCYGFYEETHMFVDILKSRTQCNLIGFFQTPTIRNTGFIGGYAFIENYENKTKFKTDKFIAVPNSGFDEFYAINCRELAVKPNLAVDAKMSKTKLAKEFIKFSNKKAVNRVLLTRFIAQIAGETKKAA